MTVIANLDAAIEEHYAQSGQISKEIQIFGKVWSLEPVLTTAQLDPLMKVQAASEIANDTSRNGTQEEQMAAIAMVGALPEIIAMIVVEEQRTAFRAKLREKGIPLPVVPKVLEAIFVAYDAAPFTSEEPTSSVPHPTNTQLLASTTDSGSSPATTGQRSNTPSNPSPTDTHSHPPVPAPVTDGGQTPIPTPQQAAPSLQAVPTPSEAAGSPQMAAQTVQQPPVPAPQQ